MAGMDERRNEGGCIIVGCLVVGLLLAVVLLLGVAWVRLSSSSALYGEQQVTEAAQQTQVSAIAEEKPISPQEMPGPEVK